ncbi:hypothetical protein V6W80_20710 [Pseudomonas benzopyrenica]|uniref:Uncharacterized protein n=1 Tax=Pseudomonas benzopyrenica TaxID=2993566 RepID=A0ABZ2FMQ2_9PSED
MRDNYKFEMKGRAFEDGDRLDKVAAGLQALQHIFDGQFRAISDKKRLHEQDRQLFQARIFRYEDGSFIAYLGVAYSGLQTALPFIQGTPNIWEATKNAFDFLKNIYESAHNGEEVKITHEGNGNTIVHANSSTIIYNGPVVNIGTQIIGAVRELDDLLDNEEVSKVVLEGPDSTPILEMESSKKGLYYPPTRIDDSPIQILCDIYDFNKYDKTGKARISTQQKIPLGNYKFRSIGDQSVEEFILSMTEPQVLLNCLIKYQTDPLSESKINEILVISIAA